MSKTGNFDLDFPGAIIFCNSEDKRRSLIKFLNKKSNSIGDFKPGIDINDSIEEAIYATVYEHEGKHLHDHLTCPMLLHNYTLKLTSLFYSTLAINAWDSGFKNYRVIPLPFTEWIELPKDTKKSLLALRGLTEEDVPIYSLNDAVQLLNGAFKCDDQFLKAILLGALHFSEYKYNISHNNADGYNSKISIKTCTEGLAFIQQMTELALRYGIKGESVLHKILELSFENFQSIGTRKREKGDTITDDDYAGISVYTVIFTMAYRYAIYNKINQNYLYPFIAYVLFWSLSGNILFDPKNAVFPRTRLERLFNLDYVGIDLELSNEDNIQRLFNDPLGTFNIWDRYIGSSFLGTNIHIQSLNQLVNVDISSTPLNYLNTTRKLFNSFIPMVEYLNRMGYKEVANYMYNISDAMNRMTSVFYKHPSYYLYPESYSKNINAFVNVPFKIEFDQVEPIIPEECLIIRDGISFYEHSIWGNTLYQGDSSSNNLVLDWKKYAECKKYLDFSNILYGSTDLNMPGRLVKEFLPGIKTWFFKTL